MYVSKCLDVPYWILYVLTRNSAGISTIVRLPYLVGYTTTTNILCTSLENKPQ